MTKLLKQTEAKDLTKSHKIHKQKNQSNSLRRRSTATSIHSLPIPIHWGARTALERGPIIGTTSNPLDRNVIGSHSGPYTIYRALQVATGHLDPLFKPNFYLTDSTVQIQQQVPLI